MASAYLCVMGAHGSVASEGASRVAVAGIGKRVIFDLVVPRLHQLQDGSVAASGREAPSQKAVSGEQLITG